MLHLIGYAAETVMELRRETVEIGLLRQVGQPAIKAEPHLQIRYVSLRDQHRSADIDQRRPGSVGFDRLLARPQSRHRLFEHRLIKFEAHLLDMARLFLAQEIAGAADIEIMACER